MQETNRQKRNQELNTYWIRQSRRVLLGRFIKRVRYLTDEEMKLMDWHKRPICFELDNGTICIPSMDDEGNDGGSLFYQQEGEELSVLPVI